MVFMISLPKIPAFRQGRNADYDCEQAARDTMI
jgi:hypothetical protein